MNAADAEAAWTRWLAAQRDRDRGPPLAEAVVAGIRTPGRRLPRALWAAAVLAALARAAATLACLVAT
jgi:hypothetical protein